MDSLDDANRQGHDPLAATLIECGTDVNFGELTRKLFKNLQKQSCELKLGHRVQNIQKTTEGWTLTVKDSSGQNFATFLQIPFYRLWRWHVAITTKNRH